jgi:hypothetical protein
MNENVPATGEYNTITEQETRLIAAALALCAHNHEWLADQLKVPLPSFRARLYRQRAELEGELEAIWNAFERAGVRRLAARNGQGPGLRLI